MSYCTLITGILIQQTPLSYGGNQPHEQVDLPFARDGLNRPVLRGSALAGVFIHQAGKMFGPLPKAIIRTADDRPAEADKRLSCWRFEHAHLLTDTATQFHQHVSIHPDTGAARDDHLFSVETLPAGSQWGLVMSIWPDEMGNLAAVEKPALQLLHHWQQHGCRLGRGSGHGYGWMKLDRLNVWHLDQEQAHLWPNALEDLETPEQIETYLKKHGLTPEPLSKQNYLSSPYQLLGTIRVEAEQGDYGLNTLSIGGHKQLDTYLDNLKDKVVGLDKLDKNTSFEPDFVINTEPDPHHPNQRRPVIPGTAIRGVLRQALTRWQKPLGLTSNCIDWLFGTTEQAGALKITNAYIDNDDWKLLWQQHVAIDEFTGGSYEGAKFDRLALINGQFTFTIHVEPPQGDMRTECVQALLKLVNVLGPGYLPIGGGIWKGHGRVHWTLTPKEEQQI